MPILKKRTLAAALTAGLALSLGPTARAHHVWIEQDAQGARLYFGEFADNVREASPGLLDKFVQPTASLLSTGGAETLRLSKGAQAFALSKRAAPGESLIAEEASYPAFEKKDGDKVTRTAWTPAARWVGDFSARAPKLTLDVVPTGERGAFQVFYQGQPLPEAKVQVVAASGWGRELKADKEGVFRLALPWQGAYAAEVHHVDKRGGERGSPRHDIASYVTTLSFALDDGMASPPPLPEPAKP